LRAHWIIYFAYSREQSGQFAVFLLDEHFTAERILSRKLGGGDIQKYVNSIQASVRKWHCIHFPHLANDLSDGARSALERIGRLDGGAFEPLMMAALQKESAMDQLLKLLALAERFIFLVSKVCQRRSNTGDSEFYRLAGQLYRGEVTLPDVRAVIDDRTQHFFSADKAISEIHDLFSRGEGFYSWSGRRYFLYEYEQHLRGQAGMEVQRLHWRDLIQAKSDHVTIEHIYPQTAKSDDWPAFNGLSVRRRRSLLNSLGNLLPLSVSRNAKFSNRPFAAKRHDSGSVRGYYNGSYCEIRVAQNDDWTPEAIRARGLEMLEFLEARWNVSFGSEEKRLQFLGLDDD
jgi:hypothetical protein